MLSQLMTAGAMPTHRLLAFVAESESLSAKHGRMPPGPQSSIGFRLVGTTIDEILPWGPAHLSEEIMVHDEILEVDGNPVTASNVAQFIVGQDECNSNVELAIKKADGSGVRTVRLRRVFRPLVTVAEDLFQTLVQVCSKLSTSAPEVIPELERALDAVSALQIGNHDNLQAILDKVNDPLAKKVQQVAQICLLSACAHHGANLADCSVVQYLVDIHQYVDECEAIITNHSMQLPANRPGGAGEITLSSHCTFSIKLIVIVLNS